jgi:hypothetical protein
MALSSGWQQYATTAPITPVNQAFPLAAPASTSAASTAKPTGMDPFSIGLSLLSTGASIFGGFQQKSAAEEQADAAREAADIAAKASEKAAKTAATAQLAGKIGGFGLDFLTSRYEGGAGASLNRINTARDIAQRANIEANNPSMIALRSAQRYEDRLKDAMPGFMPATNLFV